jgi:NAD(P)H-quinone oxidoreductase subunit 5
MAGAEPIGGFMDSLLPWLAALGPALLLIPGLVPEATADRAAGSMRRLSLAAALGALGLAALTGSVLILSGRALPGAVVQLDAVSGVMFALVAAIGAVVIAYSHRYLDGDPGQGRFFKWLSLTLAAVLSLVLAGNLILLALAWIGAGFGLHRLLLFYGDRKPAQLAARKMRLTSRLADACLLAALLVASLTFGSVEIAAIQEAARAMQGQASLGVHVAALLLAQAALLKSAQFPAHGWLAEVMETPTPVSALLHAGIINAGGFLLVRLADVVALSAGALDLLLLVGAMTAVFGAAAMLTQTSVKVNLAWSTVAQMGFMVMQCGLGAFAAALLHIVAHALYKAHAFLSAGGVASVRRPEKLSPLPLRVLLPGLAGAVLLTLFVGAALGMPATTDPGPAVLAAVLVMALVPTLATGTAGRASDAFALRAFGMAGLVALLYFGLQAGAAALLAPALPATIAERSIFAPMLSVLTVLAFAALLVLNVARRAPVPGRMVEALYVHLVNGFYVNAAFNRLINKGVR